MATLDYPSRVPGYTQRYDTGISYPTGQVISGGVTGVWRGEIFMESMEGLLEERLEQTLEVCVNNTKQYIKDIDLWETGDLHNSIRYWDPERRGRYLVGSYGVPLTHNGKNMDYGLYQEVGFHHTNGQFIQNEFLLNGLQRSSSEIRAIWTSGVTSTKTFGEV